MDFNSVFANLAQETEEEKKEIEAAAPKSDTDALVGTHEPKHEEKKEVDDVYGNRQNNRPNIRSYGRGSNRGYGRGSNRGYSGRGRARGALKANYVDPAQWAVYLRPMGYIGTGRFQEPNYSHLCDALKKFKPAFNLNKDGSVTFYPAPYLKSQELGQALLQQVPFEKSNQFQNIMKEVECTKLEASFDSEATVISAPNDVHGFIASLEIAFFKHYPLSLSVSQIWLLILQGLG